MVTAIHAIGGKLHLDGYPDAQRCAKLTSKLAHRLADMSMHRSALTFCIRVLRELPSLAENSAAREGAVVGVATKFFSCFGENKVSARLDPKKVFSRDFGALECYFHWKGIRDGHFAHNESRLASNVVGVVLDAESNVIDTISLLTTPQFATDTEHCNLLLQLCVHALRHVEHQVAKIQSGLMEELRQMSKAQRSALEDLRFDAPDFSSTAARRTR